MSDIYDLGGEPPLGEIPKRMHAFAVRQNRFGQPAVAWKREILATPSIGPDEVLIYVMASGINFNNVWRALGTPLDVIAERQKQGEPEDFHAGGSDCSGIVWAVGRAVTNVAVGDHVIVHSGWWRPDDPWVLSGRDPMLAASTRIWGYQTNYGSYCQFARAQAHQCLSEPEHLTWEEAGCFLLCASTAYRMLRGWSGHTVQPDDVVLVWGAAGGLGSMALGITRAFNGRAVAVVSDDAKRAFCLEHGAAAVINRRHFTHHFDLRLRHWRHGGHLRRDDWLRRHDGPSIPVDAAEALSGKPPLERRRSGARNQTRRRQTHAAMPFANLRLR